MKESFLLLPEERQNEIINAGYDQLSGWQDCRTGTYQQISSVLLLQG